MRLGPPSPCSHKKANADQTDRNEFSWRQSQLGCRRGLTGSNFKHYSPGIDEKRWVDAVLARKQGLGL